VGYWLMYVGQDFPSDLYHDLNSSNPYQEMGLGKTLSVLALIAWFLDTLDNASLSKQPSIPRTTLIVAPKSSKIHIILENISATPPPADFAH
jgi:hypothetical protein